MNDIDPIQYLEAEIARLEAQEQQRRDEFDAQMQPLREEVTALKRQRLEMHMLEWGQMILREGDELRVTQAFWDYKRMQGAGVYMSFENDPDWRVGEILSIHRIYEHRGGFRIEVRETNHGSGGTVVSYAVAVDMRRAYLDYMAAQSDDRYDERRANWRQGDAL